MFVRIISYFNKNYLVNKVAELEVKDFTTQAALFALKYGFIFRGKFCWDKKKLQKTDRKQLLCLYKEIKKDELG